MRFLRPDLVWWIGAALVAVGVVRWRVRRTFAASTTVRWLSAPRYRASILRGLPTAVLVVALILIGCALMDPVLPYAQSTISSRGLDIVVALDLSSSMLEEMGRPKPPRSFQNLTFSSRDATLTRAPGENRLTATKHAIKTFVTSRRDDRIGLVVFSDNAHVISPLTFDRDYVVRYVDLVDDQLLRGEGMTSIGDGLALANHLLASASARDAAQRGLRRDRNQVVVLFTDGENNHGRDPMEVLGESNAANIRVHMVGVDLEEEIRNKPQVQRLFQSVRRYGGRYFNAATARDLDAASRTIDSIEKGVLVSRAYIRDAPVYQWFALPALLCLAAAIGVRAIPYFIDQT
jgi:Ca-activated chloride channel family protein